MTRLVVLGLTVLISACAFRSDPREEYEKEMNAVCRSANESLAALPSPIDLGVPIEGQEERVRRIDAQTARISRQAEARLRAVDPPAEVSMEHKAFLAALYELKRTSTRLNELARQAGQAYEEGEEKRANEAYGRMGESLKAFRAAQEKADRAATRLGLSDCRQQR